MKNFRQFLRPESVEEAISLKKAIGPAALFVAGGTTVVPGASKAVEVLIDLSRLGLDGISLQNGVVLIGAATKLSALLSPEVAAALPLLHGAAQRCATPIVRNMATVGGALAGIYLPSDVGVALLASGARLTLHGDKRRVVTAEHLLSEGWLSGYDVIVEVAIGTLRERTGASFQKFGRSAVDIALVNVAAVLRLSQEGKIDELRVGVGQTSSRPFLVKDAAAAAGEQLTMGLVKRVARSASDSVDAKSDSKASSAYRKHLIEVLVGRAIIESAEGIGVQL